MFSSEKIYGRLPIRTEWIQGQINKLKGNLGISVGSNSVVSFQTHIIPAVDSSRNLGYPSSSDGSPSDDSTRVSPNAGFQQNPPDAHHTGSFPPSNPSRSNAIYVPYSSHTPSTSGTSVDFLHNRQANNPPSSHSAPHQLSPNSSERSLSLHGALLHRQQGTRLATSQPYQMLDAVASPSPSDDHRVGVPGSSSPHGIQYGDGSNDNTFPGRSHSAR